MVRGQTTLKDHTVKHEAHRCAKGAEDDVRKLQLIGLALKCLRHAP